MLECENLAKSFEKDLFGDFNLKLNPGEIVAITGPSGCGKTTLLRCICGLEQLDSGKIILSGNDITAIAAEERGIGLIFQKPVLYPHLNVEGNLKVASKHGDITTALNEVNYLPSPSADPSVPDPLGRLFLFKAGTFPTGIDFDGGQVKLTSSSTPSSATYVGEVESYSDADGNVFSFIQVSQTVSSPDPDFSIDIRPVRLTTKGNPVRQKLFNFDPFPLYFFAKLGDNAAVNNISIKETSGGFQRTISPKFYAFGDNTAITNASGQADVSGEPPTNFIDVTRLSSAQMIV